MRHSFPFYPQHDAMDCGPACLRMVAKHYGKDIDLNTLRQWSSYSREGVSLLGISKAAERIGFRTLSVKIPFDGIETSLVQAPMPCIIHWNENHFIVVHRYAPHQVHLVQAQIAAYFCCKFITYAYTSSNVSNDCSLPSK